MNNVMIHWWFGREKQKHELCHSVSNSVTVGCFEFFGFMIIPRLVVIASQSVTIALLAAQKKTLVKVRSKSFSKHLLSKNERRMIIIILIFDIFRCWSTFGIASPAVGYYRTAVGYYRVIAQKIIKSKKSDQRLFRTSKITKNGPVTAENHKNE